MGNNTTKGNNEMSAIIVQTEGRRFYLIGNTYPIRRELRSAGAKWDAGRKAWWTSKHEVVDKFVGAAPQNAAQKSDLDGLYTKVTGRAKYKGHSYYLLWSGETKRGQAAKLCFRDGSKSFWADLSAVQIIKCYEQPRSIKSLQEYAEVHKHVEHTGDYPNGHRYLCDECDEWVTAGDGSRCWETGCAH